MASTLSITGCSIDTNLITITFSDDVDQTSSSGDTSAINPANYTIFDPDAGYSTPTIPTGVTVTAVDSRTISFPPPVSPFNAGDFVLIGISNIAFKTGSGTPALIDDPVSIARQVPGKGKAARLTRDVEDAISYPILTEEIGYRPSPVGIPTGGGGGGMGGGGGSSLGQVAMKAVSDVLGWKPSTTDPRGFLGALTQSFTLTDVEGHVESKWTPRTYAVQTDLGGGITGAQASLYTRAKDALDQSLSLLDGLYPLDPEADPEYVKALREMARSQMTEIVKEFGVVGLPSILRIDTYFDILLGQNPGRIPASGVQFNPDEIKGTLGELRNTYGIQFVGNPFNNSVEDEQDITNFRMISDYMTSLMQSWIANRQFFILDPAKPAFFGTQLVLISRQFNVIAETVNETRFTLDSVFIGPNERQTLLLEFVDGTPPMFLEDVLKEVERFVTDEGPRLLRDGGKISVTNNILPVMQSLQNLVEQAHEPRNIGILPDGFRTARVRNSLDDLEDQLEALIDLVEQVEQQVPPSEDALTISGISMPLQNLYDKTVAFSTYGRNFTPHSQVTINSTPSSAFAADTVVFVSAQRLDVTFSLVDTKGNPRLASGTHDVTVTNDDGETETLDDAFRFDGTTITSASKKAIISGIVRAPGSGATPGTPAPPVPGGPPAATASDVAKLNTRMDEMQKSQDSLSNRVNDMLNKMNEVLDRDDKNKKK